MVSGAPVPEGNGVRVTNREIYDALVVLSQRFEALEDRVEQNSMVRIDHEVRLRKLEGWRYALPTASIIAFGSIIIALIEHFHGGGG